MLPYFHDEHFDTLASGLGDFAAATEALQGEQYRLTMRRLAYLAATNAREPFAEGMALLNTLPEAAKAKALGHPNVNLWSAHYVELGKGSANKDRVMEGLGYFGAVAAAAAIHAERPFEPIKIPLQDGATAMLPTLGKAVFQRKSQHAFVEHSRDGHTSVSTDEETIHVPPDSRTDAPGWLGLRHLEASLGDQQVTVELDDINPYRQLSAFEARPAERLSPVDAARWQHNFGLAAQFMAEHLPDLAPALFGVLHSIVPLERNPAYRMARTTVLGSVALNLSSVIEMAVDLAEQFYAGQFLAMHQVQPLHDSPLVERHYYSPTYDQPMLFRDFLGVLYRHPIVARMWHIRRDLSEPESVERFIADLQLARWTHRLSSYVHAARSSQRLTKAGLRVLDGVELHKNNLLRAAQPVDKRAAEMALFANTVHRLDWRLHHLQPAGPAIEMLGDDFVAGREPPLPVVVPAAVVMPQGSRQSPKLIRENVLYEAMMSGHYSANTVFVARQTTPVVDETRNALMENPEDRQLWLKLASRHLHSAEGRSTQALVSCPEVVRAVCLHITKAYGLKADPISVGLWLTNVRSVEQDCIDE